MSCLSSRGFRSMRGVGRHQSGGVNYSLNPEIAEGYMTQREGVEEIEENLKDAFRLRAMDDVPQDYKTKEIAL